MTTVPNDKQRTGRTSYTFAVGKMNVAILSNFSEIDCFILVACPEHSLLEDEKEYPVPIITPLELCMALNVVQWGSVDYCLDVKEYLSVISKSKNGNRTNDVDSNDDNDSDAPYFSLVTGGYESTKHDSLDRFKGDTTNNLAGQGAITTYNSAAAEFLKQREYQGLDIITNTKDATLHSAIQGQSGIASKYGDR
jgi:diphthamide biosynthesis protein 2